MSISDLGEKRFLFRFFHDVDVTRVIYGTSWFFNNHILILSKIQSGEDQFSMELVFSEFWIQVHNLPPRLMIEVMKK